MPDRAAAGLASAAGDGSGLEFETVKLHGAVNRLGNVIRIFGRAGGAASERARCSIAALASERFGGAVNSGE